MVSAPTKDDGNEKNRTASRWSKTLWSDGEDGHRAADFIGHDQKIEIVGALGGGDEREPLGTKSAGCVREGVTRENAIRGVGLEHRRGRIIHTPDHHSAHALQPSEAVHVSVERGGDDRLWLRALVIASRIEAAVLIVVTVEVIRVVRSEEVLNVGAAVPNHIDVGVPDGERASPERVENVVIAVVFVEPQQSWS